MPVGVDTGFFFLLEAENETAVRIWNNKEIITSAVVLYELQKKLLKGHFKGWPTLLEDIKRSVVTVSLTSEIALRAGHLAHGTGMPGLDALILASLLDAGCNEIYTTDPHFRLFKKKGVNVILFGR